MEVTAEKVSFVWKPCMIFKAFKHHAVQGSQGTDSGYHSGPANVPNRGTLDIDRFYGVSRDHVSINELNPFFCTS